MKLAPLLIEGRRRFGAVFDGGFVDLTDKLGPDCSGLEDLLALGLVPVASELSQGDVPIRSLDDVVYLPPLSRGRVFALGAAYKDHQLEIGRADAAAPSFFSKFASTFVGHRSNLMMPTISSQLDFEGEIVVVIGKGGRNIEPDQAMDHVAGYSIANDGSVRDWQKHSLLAGKNFEASGSFGPWIVTKDDIPLPEDMRLITTLNGQQMQECTLGQLIWPVGVLINYLSTIMTLQPGDAISTGTPAGVGHRRNPQVFMKPGDELKISVAGIGELVNRVAAPIADR